MFVGNNKWTHSIITRLDRQAKGAAFSRHKNDGGRGEEGWGEMEEEEKRGWKRMKVGYYLVVQYDGLAATGLDRK